MMSGPYRLTADLVRGVVDEAQHAPGTNGDGARPDALTMPVTSTRSLDAKSAEQIRRLGRDVFEHGVFSSKACPAMSIPTADSFHIFYITEGGVTRSFSAPAACDTVDALELQHTLYCSANPTGYGCIQPQ
jgi:hypothetical protein